MTPLRWFLFFAGAGGLVGFVLLVAEKRPLGATVGFETPKVRRR